MLFSTTSNKRMVKLLLKPTLALSLLIGLMGSSVAPLAMAQNQPMQPRATSAGLPTRAPLKGSLIHSEKTNNSPTVNYDDVREVEPGTVLDMQLATTISAGMSVEGDEFFAKINKDYEVDGMVVIPRGTLVHGTVSTMTSKKRAGRDGWVATNFDYMITPDGREIPIEGKYSSKDKKFKAAAKVVGKAAGYTAVGGVIGAFMVLKYGGLPLVAATEGYALAGGAAIGGAAGLTTAMIKKGKSANIPVGADIRVQLKEPIALPTVNMPDAGADNYMVEGLDVSVLGMNVGRDPFGEMNEVTLSLDIKNYTENSFTSFDIGLEDEYGNTFYPSPFGDTGMWFRKLTPNSRAQSNVTFSVDDPKRKHYLVFFKQYSREKVGKIAIMDDMKITKKELKNFQKAHSGE